MKAAALDLGSNTLRLLVAEPTGRGLRIWGRGLASPRLGRGLAIRGRLDPGAKAQALIEARALVEQARTQGAQRVVLAATQACRVAGDGAEFVAHLGRELGLDRARVLTGLEEAALSRLGVLAFLQGPTQGALLADVGGGSSEVVDLGDNPGPALSLPLGAVSLTEAHLAGDPPSPAQMTEMDRAVDRGLAGLTGRRAGRLVASAGTAATLAAQVLGLRSYEPERINNLVVGQERLEQEAARLAGLPLEKRRQALALEPGRADIIIAGLAILRGLLRLTGLSEITLMDAGLLEGILLDDLASQP